MHLTQKQKLNLVQLAFFLGLLFVSGIIYYFLTVRSAGALIGLYPVTFHIADLFWLITGLVLPLAFLRPVLMLGEFFRKKG